MLESKVTRKIGYLHCDEREEIKSEVMNRQKDLWCIGEQK
jgi:hypothetical protein